MDGVRLNGVKGVEFSINADSLSEVRLTLHGYVEIDSEFSEGDMIKAARPLFKKADDAEQSGR